MQENNPTKLIYIDIETVPQYESYIDLPLKIRELWNKKAKFIKSQKESEVSAYKRAGIYAEFGKIICISVGGFKGQSVESGFKIKSFYGHDEVKLLNQFTEMLNQAEKKGQVLLCAHNGKEFDFPYISRRMIINKIKLPNALNISGKKPWEINHFDTMEMWRFGDYKNFTSLDLLTSVLDIPSPKNNMDGSQVADYYYKFNDIKSIKEYCQNDVLAIAQLVLRYQNMNLIEDKNVEFIE